MCSFKTNVVKKTIGDNTIPNKDPNNNKYEIQNKCAEKQEAHVESFQIKYKNLLTIQKSDVYFFFIPKLRKSKIKILQRELNNINNSIIIYFIF